MSAPQTGPVNIYDALQRVTGAIGLGPGAREAAAEQMRQVLAESWNYCANAILSAKPGTLTFNPYMDAAATRLPDDELAAQHHDSIEELATDLATAAEPEHDGVWIVWTAQGDRSQGLSAIYPSDEEIEALRQVNADGYGHAEFIEYGPV